jgi:hypothetical protein
LPRQVPAEKLRRRPPESIDHCHIPSTMRSQSHSVKCRRWAELACRPQKPLRSISPGSASSQPGCGPDMAENRSFCALLDINDVDELW